MFLYEKIINVVKGAIGRLIGGLGDTTEGSVVGSWNLRIWVQVPLHHDGKA